MLRTLFSAFWFSVAAASPVAASVDAFSLKDEIAGTEIKIVTIRAETYREITNEEELRFRCVPYKGTGYLEIEWHRGDRYGGSTVEEIIYKVDDAPPVTFNVLKDSGASIIGHLSTGNTLIMRPKTVYPGSFVPTVRFSLRGSAAAFKTLEKQCPP
ncbi:MAG: hypothetical protein AB7I36_08245 [Rhodospirillaceae bacterium]